jgi:DnaJ-class molecular chaperone
MQAHAAKQPNEKIPIPCENCHGTGIVRGIECRECLGRGHRVIVAGRVVPLSRQPHRYSGRR